MNKNICCKNQDGIAIPPNMAAHAAEVPNWFWISLGRNVAIPEVENPSKVPASVMNKKAGFFTRIQKDRGMSLSDFPNSFTAFSDVSSVWVSVTRVSRTCWAAEIFQRKLSKMLFLKNIMISIGIYQYTYLVILFRNQTMEWTPPRTTHRRRRTLPTRHLPIVDPRGLLIHCNVPVYVANFVWIVTPQKLFMWDRESAIGLSGIKSYLSTWSKSTYKSRSCPPTTYPSAGPRVAKAYIIPFKQDNKLLKCTCTINRNLGIY